MANYIDEDKVTEALRNMLEKEVKIALDAIVIKAHEELEEKLKSQLAKISLKLLNYYSISTRNDEIIITVRNDAKL